jgi:protein O-mannosyl-transferase
VAFFPIRNGYAAGTINMQIAATRPEPALKPDRTILVLVLLAAATLAVYWPVIGYDFIGLDDPLYFADNFHVQTGLRPSNMAWAFTTVLTGNWHPLTWLSLMLDAELFGKSPFGPHLTNLAFHTGNTVLLFLLLRRMTGALWRSALVAALFALHPLHVESVAWISERKDVLSMFFALLTMLAYVGYARRRTTPENQSSLASYVLALFCYALGLMSKPMLVTLPFVLLLLDIWPLERVALSNWKEVKWPLVREKIPFFFLSALSCVVTFLAQRRSGAVFSVADFPLSGRLANAFVSYGRYLGKTLWPSSLAVPYPFAAHWPAGLVLFSVLLVAGLSVVAVKLGGFRPFVPVGWFWFLGTMVPVIGIIQTGEQSMADRYTYLPLVGIFVVFVWGAAEASRKWLVPGTVLLVPTGALLLGCGIVTRNQLSFWQNTETLLRHTLTVTSDNWIANDILGDALAKKNRPAEAIDYYNKGLEINPGDPIGLCRLGEAYAMLGDGDKAMAYFDNSLRIRPNNPEALYNLGNVFAKRGDWDRAIPNYRRSLDFAPDQPDVLNNLGMAMSVKKQYPEAVTNFEAALKLAPDSVDAHNNLGTVLFLQGRYEQAIEHYREASRLAPNNPQISSNLGDALAKAGRFSEAAQSYQTALGLNPGDSRIRAKLQALSTQIPN